MKDPVQHLTKDGDFRETLCGRRAQGPTLETENSGKGVVGYYDHWPMGSSRENCLVDFDEPICKTCLKMAEHHWAIGALEGVDT